MKRQEIWGKLVSKTGKKSVALAVAASMALSGVTYAMTGNAKVAEDEPAIKTFISGDVNEDGFVKLDDAQLCLRAALHLTTLTDAQKYAADVNSDDTVNMKDAQMILRHALHLENVPSKEPMPTSGSAVEESVEPSKTQVAPPKPPTSVAPRSAEPKPTLEPVEAKEENVEEGYAVSVRKLNGAQKMTVTGASAESIVFGPIPTPKPGQSEDDMTILGVQMDNPFAGKTELQETVADAVRTVGVNGRQTVWELTGAAVTKDQVISSDWDMRVRNAEPQGETLSDPENIDYTRPEWKNGISVSFWLKAKSDANNAPILVFEDGNTILSLRMNGTVRYFDNNDASKQNAFITENTTINGDYGDWNYYTITVKNDWIQSYVNGEEIVYDAVELSSDGSKRFNDGFLTRYSVVNYLNEEMVQNIKENDPRLYYYYVTRCNNNNPAWNVNIKDDPDTRGDERFFDDYSVFKNMRFGGNHMGEKLIMDFITGVGTKMWIGGTYTDVETSNTQRKVDLNTNVADVRAYDVELTPEQVAANYKFATSVPTEITWDESKADEPGGDDGSNLVVAESKWASYDEDTGIITFEQVSEEDGRNAVGLEITNPFAGMNELRQTLEESLEGQSIFPYKKINGGTIDADASTYIGSDTQSVVVMRGNFYDVYYGPIEQLGNWMNPATCIGKVDPITNAVKEDDITDVQSEEWMEEHYGDQKTTYQRPKWTKGVSMSFWAKPVQVDDSPLVTFVNSNDDFGMALSVSVQGDVLFYSLSTTVDWEAAQIANNRNPRNTFNAVGDPSYVKEGQWNYYTITIANDWITVYVNGKELVYTQVNLNRGQLKQFNYGYLTRYNTIGIWTNRMIDAKGDPSGTTLDGTPRNYLTKSGYIWNLDAPTDADGHVACHEKNASNNSCDSASIRFNAPYSDPFRKNPSTVVSKDILTRLTYKGTKLYLGGVDSNIRLDGKFSFTNLVMPEGTNREIVHYAEPVENTNPDTGEVTVVDKREKYFFTDHLLDRGTKMAGVTFETKEMTAEEVQEAYTKAAPDAPTE